MASRLRALARSMIGRDRPIWLRFGTPRLRYTAFQDIVDTALFSVIRDLRDVEFLQVGSNDGRTNDPLWTFRRYRGCRGVLVEPFEGAYRRLVDNYAPFADRYRFVNAAVGLKVGMVEFHYFAGPEGAPPGFDQLGSLDPGLVRAHARGYPADGSRITSTRVRGTTFEELCAQLRLNRIDVLHVDAEGSDAEILLSVDFGRWKPHVVVFEHAHLTARDLERVRIRLTDSGYWTHRLEGDTLALRRTSFARSPGLAFVHDLLEARPTPGLVP